MNLAIADPGVGRQGGDDPAQFVKLGHEKIVTKRGYKIDVSCPTSTHLLLDILLGDKENLQSY